MIKYRGGKLKEIPYFRKYIPSEYDTYIEPFFGGGAVFFDLEPSKAIVNDINSDLILFYREIQNNYFEVHSQLEALAKIYERNQQQYNKEKSNEPNSHIINLNEELYYHIRDMFNGKVEKEYLPSVIYYFINKTAYSGMIRYNSQGEYNVPFGRYKHFNVEKITEEHHSLLQNTRIYNDDYIRIFNMSGVNDFMFLDPPYDCIFNDYGNLENKNGFDEEQHRRLAIDFVNLDCKALMIIGKTKLTEALYKPYICDEYDKSYAVNIKNRFKSAAVHIVVKNY